MTSVCHIYLSILAEAVAKKAMLAHYTEGEARRYHHTGMLEELRKFMAEVEESGVLNETTIEAEAA